MRPLTFVTVAAVAAAALAPTAHAAPPKPKPFSKTVAVTDATPDPTAGGIATDSICLGGALPHEDGFAVKLPAPGKFKVELTDFTGDWGLALTSSSNGYLTGDDQNPPTTEGVSYKAKKAMTVKIFACNLEGAPKGSVKYTYTPT